MFLVNIPLVVAALVAGHRLVPRSKDPEARPLDVRGAALSIVAVGALVYAVIEAPHRGWASVPTLVAFFAAAIALVAFLGRERSARQPMLDLRLFRDRRFSVSSAVYLTLIPAATPRRRDPPSRTRLKPRRTGADQPNWNRDERRAEVTDSRSIGGAALAGPGHPSRHKDLGKTVSGTPGTGKIRRCSTIARRGPYSAFGASGREHREATECAGTRPTEPPLTAG